MIQLKQDIENEKISAKIKELFPDYKVIVPALNKKTTMIIKNGTMASRVLRRKGALYINTSVHIGIKFLFYAIPVGIILAVFRQVLAPNDGPAWLVGALTVGVTWALMYFIYRKDIARFSDEVAHSIEEEFGQQTGPGSDQV